MANPFKKADRDGAPSIRPTPPESAETPMPDPTVTHEVLVETFDQPVNRPAPPPSTETPMGPSPAPPSAETPPAEN